jgi:hypothetical protein
LAGAGAGLCSAAATAFPALRPLAGLGLGLGAMAIALTAALLGGLALSLPPEEDPPR